jgi:peptidyl-prolyl cis-trans isomerase SurA
VLHTHTDAQTLDRIVAVVGEEIILESELNAQVQFFVFNNRVDEKTPGLKEQVLDLMVNEKLLVAKAVEDSVIVSDDEVQQRLDAVIQQRVQQVGSEARLEDLYGMPITRIKREFREQMKKNLLAERLQQQHFAATSTTRREVEEFFVQYRDSLGQVPEQVDLAHIAIKVKAGGEALAQAGDKARSLLDSLHAGVPFADIARRHSEDPGSASRGGDLGFVRRGQFVKEFETAVFALAPGEISEPVETEFGLHIIELLERRGEAVHPRHILIRIERSQADREAVIARLDSIRTLALGGADFATLASNSLTTRKPPSSAALSDSPSLQTSTRPSFPPLRTCSRATSANRHLSPSRASKGTTLFSSETGYRPTSRPSRRTTTVSKLWHSI